MAIQSFVDGIEVVVDHSCWFSPFQPKLPVHGDDDKPSEYSSNSEGLPPCAHRRWTSSNDRHRVKELLRSYR